MAEIFISYKSERRKAARHLEQILIRHGYTVWFDHALVRGHDYEAQIQREIGEAKAVIVLWCALSVNSEAVRSEASYAKHKGKQVPVLIEPCELPLFSALTQRIDLTKATCAPSDPAFYPLLDDIERLVGRAPQPEYKALRDYDATWRAMGAFAFAGFPLETGAASQPVLNLGAAAPSKTEAPDSPAEAAAPPAHAPSRAERDWERENIAESEDADIIAAYIEQYAMSERIWAAKARQRLKAVEALIAGRAAQERLARERAEKERLAKEEAERAAQAARFKAQGRIEIAAPFVSNANGRWFLPGAGKTEWFKDLENGPEMAVIPSGKFMMGSPQNEPERSDSEGPQHEVTIPEPFAIGRCAVTRGQFAAFVAATGHKMEGGAYVWTGGQWKNDPSKSWRDPGFAQDDSHPVVCVNWDDVKAYAAWLSNASGKAYRLPSEAEWEYACRAGSVTPFWWGSSISPHQANYDGSSEPYKGGGGKGEYRKRTVPAKHFDANPWGLYQVHGNVWEWCEDCWNGNYSGAPSDGSAWTTGDCAYRVVRGGSWLGIPRSLRAACRINYYPQYRNDYRGFRVALGWQDLNP
jgi:formylglycine-generating enzyme required for sulfatase activity